MNRLLEGYGRFRAKGWPEQRGLFESLAEHGQKPDALVISCVDSRVDPAMIFDATPGQMLTVRNVANLVPPYAPDVAYHSTSAALEFGVKVLNVRNLMVLGHGLCGGVRSLLQGAPENARDFIEPWMSIAASARSRALLFASAESRQEYCELEVIRISLINLMTFPWIAERVADGTLGLHGAWFDVRNGVLSVMQADGSFQALQSESPAAKNKA